MSKRMSPHADTAPERFWPAWAFSLVFHSCVVVVMALVIQSAPHTTGGLGHSTHIVLNATEADGEAADGGDGGDSNLAPGEVQSPPEELLSAEPSELPPVVVASEAPAEPLLQTSVSTARSTANANSRIAYSESGNSGGSGRGVGTGGGGSARLNVFGVQGEGSRFVYLFDRSSSMEGAPLAAAKQQLLSSLATLENVHQFQIIFFNTRVHPFTVTDAGRRIPFATERNKLLAVKFVGGITAEGGTDRLTALKSAIASAPDVIFFLTDADDPMRAGELAEIARDNSRARAKICTIEFGRRQSPSSGSFLAELARESGGEYGYVNTTTLGRL
jgi:hypothetical protein